jgi:hypothetical protein
MHFRILCLPGCLFRCCSKSTVMNNHDLSDKEIYAYDLTWCEEEVLIIEC